MVALNAYSTLDRLVHRLAFANTSIQLAAAQIEDSLYRRELEAINTGDPVFITALPRAGTTTLLTALNTVPEFSSHLYRDMPFVMAPLLWSRLNAPFRKPSTLQERAHGDGIVIGFDSPEAFEEVIWRVFWPDHFKPDSIALWSANDTKSEAQEFMTRHFRKIIALRHEDDAGPGRYISKNNTNIARLDTIPHMFPNASILVPVRSPVAQAASLLRQHRNFGQIHAKDAFTLRYMGDIGHYEFGALHRPIQFENFASLAKGYKTDELEYWLAYWIAAYEHIAVRQDRVHLIHYEDLCQGKKSAATDLCDAVKIDRELAPMIGAHFRPTSPLTPENDAYRGPLRDHAEALYQSLTSA